MTNDSAIHAWKEKVREEYMGERKDVNDKYFLQATHLSKLLLTISAGTLAFSVTFMDDMSGAKDLYLLQLTWIGLISTIVFGITSASFSFMSLHTNRNLVNDYYTKLIEAGPEKSFEVEFGFNIWNKLLPFSNGLLFLSFVLAFIVLALFLGKNI